MSKIKVLLLTLAIMTTSAYAYNFIGSVPLPGKSIADEKLQSDTMFSVFSFGLRIATPDCEQIQITNTEVTKPKKDNKWEEIWTVKACQRTGRLPIEFTILPDGTSKFSIDYMNVKVAK